MTDRDGRTTTEMAEEQPNGTTSETTAGRSCSGGQTNDGGRNNDGDGDNEDRDGNGRKRSEKDWPDRDTLDKDDDAEAEY